MTTILQFPDASLSILASNFPDTSRTKFMIVVLVVSVIVLALIYYSSPMRLTRVLVAAITDVEKTYLEALETALVSPSDIDMVEIFVSLLFINLVLFSTTRQPATKGLENTRSLLAQLSFSLRNPPWILRGPYGHPPPLYSGGANA
jgi:hypothetical protein